jgi:hypothetical protein
VKKLYNKHYSKRISRGGGKFQSRRVSHKGVEKSLATQVIWGEREWVVRTPLSSSKLHIQFPPNVPTKDHSYSFFPLRSYRHRSVCRIDIPLKK